MWDLDAKIKVNNQIIYFVVNASHPKPLDTATSNFVVLLVLFVLLLYVPSQQLWSLRDGQFT